MGRPSKYNIECNEKAYKLCLLGATDKQIADFFEVDEATINRWKKDHPEFCESLKSGKEVADMNVINSLYNKSLGFKENVTKAIKCKTVLYDNGKRISEKEDIVYADEQVYVPPDTTACIFWLKNRKPQQWRDKIEQTIETNNVSTHVVRLADLLNKPVPNRNISDFDEEEE